MRSQVSKDDRWTIILDGDGTLWECELYYSQASQACLLRLKHAMGELPWSDDEIFLRLRRIQLAQLKQRGFYLTIFEQTWIELLVHVSARLERPFDQTLASELYGLAGAIHQAPYHPFPRVAETLHDLRSAGHRLHLLSMGDRSFQLSKVRRNGLAGYFNGVSIIQRGKGRVMYRLARLGRRTMMAGDSIALDIRPAQKLGLTPVWVRNHYLLHRGENNPNLDGVEIIDQVNELPQLLTSKYG